MPIRHHILLLVILFLLWLLLSGHYGMLLLGLGLVSCVIALLIYRKVFMIENLARISINPFGLVKYTGWLLLEIVRSNIDVLKAIISRKNIAPDLFNLNAKDLSETGQVIYANSITLTPGTVSAELEDGVIRVHALLDGAESGFADNEMHSRVKALCEEEQNKS